ncbi:hypothetical protein GCM10009841_30510 [Microlunatus panaciterrae]|uniref:Uncharacterized protein n=1 Tax=Microlunatus panaciterrae TaxID=400768 RepID=A0ABS2RFE1_9ACTN|nr:hypothetical protein [Microlunatus panaciterrae]MBM7797711.1 hypothetical protein [Microlunatus panaciterrae]
MRAELLAATSGGSSAQSIMATMNAAADYLGWGWLSISLPNLIVIATMIIIFVLAIPLPFLKGGEEA